ncbi:MAG: rhomboid family intramembrane serine protease [Caldilineaceae bacterium]
MDDWTNLIDRQELSPAPLPATNGTGSNPAPLPGAPAATTRADAQRLDEAAQRRRRTSIRRALLLMLLVVGLLWAIEGVDALTPSVTSDNLGIQPRSAEGLRNIVFAPFLHAGFGHLSANTVPLVVLGLMVLLNGLQAFVVVSLVAALSSGLGVWLLGGGNTVHLGASGVIFGYLGFLLAAAWFQRSPTAIIVAVIAVFLYGGMLWGVLPGQEGVSWLGHFFGLAGGIVAAYFLRKQRIASNGQPVASK